jgi:energy-coupling factor transporter ATP-binding protein EcfA2
VAGLFRGAPGTTLTLLLCDGPASLHKRASEHLTPPFPHDLEFKEAMPSSEDEATEGTSSSMAKGSSTVELGVSSDPFTLDQDVLVERLPIEGLRQLDDRPPVTTQSAAAAMESPESFIHFEFTPPPFERKLKSTETEGYDIQSVIENLSSNVKMGYLPDESEAFSKTNVVIMGLTGAGKSTLVNCLAGCEMEQVDPKEARERKIPQTAIRVRPKENGGARDAVAVIGLSGSKSETRVLQHIVIPGHEFVVWDAPGFEDSGGPEVSIANAVNLTRLLKVSQVKGLVIVVLLDANALQVGRGTLVKSTFDTLIRHFGSDQSRLSDHASSMLFIVTKVPPDDQFSHDTIRETVEEQAREQGVSIDMAKQILLFDPLKKHQNSEDAQDIIKSILSVKAIIGSKTLFNVSLSSRDDQLLRKIADVASDSILRHMDSGQYDEVKRQLDLLGILEIIDHPVITRGKADVQETVIHCAQEWISILKENASNYSPQGRATLRYYLKRFEEAHCLDIVLEISQFQNGYERATDFIKRGESNYQKRENEELQIELSDLLQSNNRSFQSVLKEFCDNNPDVVEKIFLRRSCTLDDLLSVVLRESLPTEGVYFCL